MLIAAVPPLSGLEPGLITPNVRLSEALIGVIGLTVLLGTRRVAAVKWGVLEWLLLAYGLLWALLAAYDSISLGQHLSLSAWGSVHRPAPVLRALPRRAGDAAHAEAARLGARCR